MTGSSTQDSVQGRTATAPEPRPSTSTLEGRKPEETSEPSSEVSPAEVSPADESADELEQIDPIPTEFTFTDGLEVELERLRTRQFFKLLRILTHGSIDVLGMLRLDPSNQTTDEFTANLIATVVFAVPEAEQETLTFLRSMVSPKPVVVPPDTPPGELGKVTKRLEDEALKKLEAEFENPELDDTVGLVEAVLRREAPHLKALGGRLIGALKFARASNQIAAVPDSSEDSQGPST